MHKDARVHVAELLPQVVAWNREYLAEVNGKLLDDPRVEIFVEDVFKVIARAATAPYDAIMLDVDNGPIAMVQDGNARLYQDAGFAAITQALKPGGIVAFWSASNDHAFAKRLERAGFSVQVIAAKVHERAKRSSHTIFVAKRRIMGKR
jgi:spermidine synthase